MTLYAKWIDNNIEEKPTAMQKVVSEEVVEDPVISVLIPDYQHLYCMLDFVNTNNGDISEITVKYGTRFYVYNLKNKKIKEYQARQNRSINLPKITLEDGQKVT